MTGLALSVCFLLGLGVVTLVTPVVLGSRFARSGARLSDLHHTHKGHVPRFGGLALVAAFVVIEVFIKLFLPHESQRIPERQVLLAGALAMFTLGFWDDLKPLGARKKLVGQVLIALAVYIGGVGIGTLRIPFSGTIIELQGWGLPITVLWLVAITNLINLIDGADGLAGGICLMLLVLLVYVGYQSGTFVLLTAGMTGAVLGFLRYNFPPARIYLGDGGAYFLGFLIAALALVNSHKGTIFAALVAPLFVLALPILDTILALLRRGLRGLPLFRPDRRHIHHRLLGAGMSRRKVVLWLYGITLVFLVMGLAAFWSGGQLLPVLLGLAVGVVLLCAGWLNLIRDWFSAGRTLEGCLAMRQEVRYALSLCRWLAQEGRRCRSVEDLFEDLKFAARKLGFSSVTLTLADGQRDWAEPSFGRAQYARHELAGGRYGVMEFSAAECVTGGDCGKDLAVADRSCPCIGDSRLFEITSELLAESWVEAVRKFHTAEVPLRFDQSVTRAPARGLQVKKGRKRLATALGRNADPVTE